jgi:hypothetical protein
VKGRAGFVGRVDCIDIEFAAAAVQREIDTAIRKVVGGEEVEQLIRAHYCVGIEMWASDVHGDVAPAMAQHARDVLDADGGVEHIVERRAVNDEIGAPLKRDGDRLVQVVNNLCAFIGGVVDGAHAAGTEGTEECIVADPVAAARKVGAAVDDILRPGLHRGQACDHGEGTGGEHHGLPAMQDDIALTGRYFAFG